MSFKAFIHMARVHTHSSSGLLPLNLSLWPAETRLLFGLIVAWSAFGLLILASASWWVSAREMGDALYTIKRQLIWLVASWGLFLVIIRSPLRRWLRLAGPALVIGLGLIALTLVMGTTVNGASRWLVLGPIQLQPTELIKPFVVLQGATLFANWRRMGAEQRLGWLALFAVLILLILKQPNLSTAALTGLLLWLIALASGLPLAWLLGSAGLGGVVGSISIMANEYQRLRVTSFLDPWKDPQGNGYQLVQSLLAIGSGGITGTGYGLSTQKNDVFAHPNHRFHFCCLRRRIWFYWFFSAAALPGNICCCGFTSSYAGPQQPNSIGCYRLHRLTCWAIGYEYCGSQWSHAHHRLAFTSNQLWRQLVAS